MSKGSTGSERDAAAPQGPPAPLELREHVEGLLDLALADTFPASDPVSSLLPDPLPPVPAMRESAPPK